MPSTWPTSPRPRTRAHRWRPNLAKVLPWLALALAAYGLDQLVHSLAGLVTR